MRPRSVGIALLECLTRWNESPPPTAWSGRRSRPPPACPGRRAARGRRARRRPAAGPGGPGHGQDDDHRRGRGRAHRRAAASTRPGCWCSRSAARPPSELRERIALRLAPDHPAAAGADLPQLRLRPGAPGVRAGRRRAARAAVGPRAAAGGAPPAARRGRRRRRGTGRSGCARRWPPAASPRSCATSCCARPSAAWTGGPWPGSGRGRGRDDWVSAGRFLDAYAARFDLAPVPAYDYSEIVRIAGGLLRRKAVRARERDAYDAILRRRVPGHRPGAGGDAAPAGRRRRGS